MTDNDNLYREYILDLYRHPMNKHSLADFDLQGDGRNPSCGDEYNVYVKLDEDKISDIGFTGEGCAISQAALSLITDAVKGKTKDEVMAITNEDMIEMLGINISYNRKKCVLLGLETIKSLISKNK
jgi:nitrogen fixation protein NifU and related proteins